MSGEHSHSGGPRRAASASTASHATTWTLCVVAVLVLYVLSIGPAVALAENGTIPTRHQDWLPVVYRPVVWLIDSLKLGATLEAYLNWWTQALRKP